MTRSLTQSAGFTIIELMVTISVLGVLLGIGVPAFTGIIRNNRIAEQTNAVVGAINYARGESVVRGIPVTICAARDATRAQCVTAAPTTQTTWANGYIIFTDRTGTLGEIDLPNDEILQTGGAMVADFTVSNTASFVRFGAGATPTTERTFTVAPTSTSVCATTGSRRIVVAGTGRVSTSKRTTCS